MTAKRKIDTPKSDKEREIWAKFDAEIQKGIDAAEAGKLVNADEFFESLRVKYRAMSKTPR